MSFSRPWVRLPGPANFLETILGDLKDRFSVIIGLPDRKLSDQLAIETAGLVKHHRIGGKGWGVVRSTDKLRLEPEKYMDRNPTVSVLWIDATDKTGVASAWVNHVQKSTEIELRPMPRFCISMMDDRAASCGDGKRLRRRLWRDFVSSLDARAIAERVGMFAGHRPANIALRSALVAELAGMDLTLAEKLSRYSLQTLIEKGDHPREKIWAAQVAVLFPLVERQRLWLLERYQNLWEVPHRRSSDGTKIQCLENLEIGDMVYQARHRGLYRYGIDKDLLNWLKRVRNTLAHNKVVSWGDLISPSAVQISKLDFREKRYL